MGEHRNARGSGQIRRGRLLEKIYFEPLAAALQSITADELGKNALKSKLKKVVIHCDGDAPASNYAAGLKFDDAFL